VKKLLIIIVMVISIVFPNIVFAGIRCGNDIIEIGDTTFEAQIKLQECGQVLGKDFVQKSLGDGTINKVENWYIRVEERGGAYCYPLIFESGVLKEIGNWKECR
jgi:hypothetical protein